METLTPILGSLLGTAVGDALGLPYEGMSRQRVRAFGEVRHRFFAGRGMLSDDTVAVALFAWLRHRAHFDDAIRSVILCGGDTDTVAAITGGICGAEVGENGIPVEWIEGLRDWPRSVVSLRRLAAALANKSVPLPCVFWPFSVLRNLVFLVIVLAHGFRRLFPPY